MKQFTFCLLLLSFLGLQIICAQDNGASETDASTLAKAAQNPLASLISLPFQNNTNFGIGPYNRVQNILNIQPVLPATAGKINIISRIILPVVSSPDAGSENGRTSGLGDLNPTIFLAPSKASKITWGVGPTLFIPTATNKALGTGKFSMGPSFVILGMPGKFVLGALVSNAWSVAGKNDRANVNVFTLNWFVNYNMPKGWYLSTAPVILVNWNGTDGNKWTVPFGGGVGKIFKLGKQPVNGSLRAYYNAVTPAGGSNVQLQAQLQFMFPK